jgi:general L-amino acid transport system permease protein
MNKSDFTPFWRDDRVLKISLQVAVVLIVILIISLFGSNFIRNFQRLGLSFGLGFLVDPQRPASFGIGDSPIPYNSTDPYIKALLVGLLNSLRVTIAGIIIATILGVTVGLGRLSDNWLVRQIATAYVETLRNIPLLLQLFFWYFAGFLQLPKIEEPLRLFAGIFLSNKGIYLPLPAGTIQSWLSLILIILSPLLFRIIWRRRTQVIIEQGKSGILLQIILIVMAIAVIFAIIFGLDWRQPQFNLDAKAIKGGINLSSEFVTLLTGLSIYTSAFIAEVVRAGIQSVRKGQWEAAKALGLKPSLVVQLVIFPQALRVMIPPLTSQFLNLTKNSSLALAIGYNDIYAVANTISNQTGKAVEMILVVMVTYLTLNLIISLGMNGLNRSVQLKLWLKSIR